MKGLRVLGAVLGLVICCKANAFTVSNAQISDDAGHALQLNAVNWFGFDDDNYAPHGLWARKWSDVIAQMKANGVNAVRIPLCPGAIHGSAVSAVNYTLNPDLQGLNSLQLLDKFIAAFDAAGIYVLLDFHVPDSSGISELWYTSGYSETQWIADLTFLAKRYASVTHVLGLDLKNEPHGAATWGTGNPATDWNKAAERAAAPLMAAAPEWLMFVEGIQDNPNDLCQNDASVIQHFWGENLEPFRCYPLNIPKTKLVLAPHVYGPATFPQAYFSASNFPNNMPKIYDTIFGYLHDAGYAVVPTEFGGQYKEGYPGEDTFENNFVEYMAGKGMTSVFYWAFNGNGWPNGGLLGTDWKTINPNKLGLLKTLWAAGPSPIANPSSPSTPPSVAMSFSPAAIAPGQSAILTWSTTNATSCTSAGSGWVSGVSIPTSYAMSTGAVSSAGPLTVGIVCTGPGGSTSRSATLRVGTAAPTLSMAFSPATISAQQAAVLTWSASNATSCVTIGTGWTDGVPVSTSGSSSTGPVWNTGPLSVGLTCTGSGGTVSGTATLTVTR